MMYDDKISVYGLQRKSGIEEVVKDDVSYNINNSVVL